MEEDQPPTRAALANASGLVAALLAATCCLLPLTLILTGLAGAGIMMSMMRYEWITLPLGVLCLVAAWWLYLRDRRQCSSIGCELIGRRGRKIVLGVATLVVGAALLLRLFPAWTSALLQRAL